MQALQLDLMALVCPFQLRISYESINRATPAVYSPERAANSSADGRKK